MAACRSTAPSAASRTSCGSSNSCSSPAADRWTADAGDWWNQFYADRDKPVPFFAAKPDENLVEHLDRGVLTPGRVLAPGGHLALTCFAAGAMGSELPDVDLYRNARLDGGLAYTPESPRWIFADLTEVELRRMRDEPPESPRFGEPFL
jgi:hypothetical protein